MKIHSRNPVRIPATGFFIGEWKRNESDLSASLLRIESKTRQRLTRQWESLEISLSGGSAFPIKGREMNVIALIVNGSTDEIGAMIGKLGMMKGVTVKSALAKNEE